MRCGLEPTPLLYKTMWILLQQSTSM